MRGAGDISIDSIRELVSDTTLEMEETKESVDESLYSRQLYVMGHEAQKQMGRSSVLLVGLDGVGVEIAKNVILAGVKSITLVDNTKTSVSDLSSQFYLTENDIGKPRADCCIQKLAQLNQYVNVAVYSGELNEPFLSKFTVVVVVNGTAEECIRIDSICHSKKIPFISTEGRGLFGKIFCDFGPQFKVQDTDGESPISCMIASINMDKVATITVTDEMRHHLESGDYVTFREITGMEILNGCTAKKVTVTGPYTFTIEAPELEGKVYQSGGYIDQVKQPKVLEFKPLVDAENAPGEFLISDFAKIERSSVLHQGFRALSQFYSIHKRMPQPANTKDADELLQLTLKLNAVPNTFHADSIDEKVIQALAHGSKAVLSPMSAFLGGIVGQETLKACSGKFTPIHQFFYFDAMECLPEQLLPSEQYQSQNSRYDDQIAVFGKDFQDRIADFSMFLVGAGAIGCEMLKNWGMMGVASNGKATIHITDMDSIEKSNLNRQFLFRSTDVQKSKSITAAKAIQQMNSEISVQPYELRVGSETESVFNDDFYESLNGVCTALDNIDARLYMDQRCLFYRLPMLESGTLGTKGNTQVVVPGVTENYGASRDPPEKSIPICTLKNFPNAIEHTLQWARDWFEGVYFQTPNDVNQYLGNSDFMSSLNNQLNTKSDTLERLKDSLVTSRPLTFDECIVWARLRFEEMFCNQIKQLLFNFPVDQVTTNGVPFWSGPKRAPTPIVFDMKDPLHLDFVISVANNRAVNYGLVGRRDREYFYHVLPNVKIPEFSPRSGVTIAANDSELNNNTNTNTTTTNNNNDSNRTHDENEMDTLISELPTPSSLAGYRMSPIEFEKDDDTHMEVIVAASNLRARNYKIKEADMHTSRFIAGKIIPAIATTTALVTGLICFEMYKLIQNKKLEDFKNGFVNLALPLFTFSEPIPPSFTKTMIKGETWNWSPWDRIDVNLGDVTMKELIDYLEKEYEVEVTVLSHGVSMLFWAFTEKTKLQKRMQTKLTDIIASFANEPVSSSCKFLIFEVCATDSDGEEVELPYVRCQIR